MGGSFSPVTGSLGAAPNRFWFGYIPDQYNMLRPLHPPSGIGAGAADTFAAANLFNSVSWWPTNQQDFSGSNTALVTWGATSLAPDGTNTAQMLVEGTANTQHYTNAGWSIGPGALFGPMRFSGFFKVPGVGSSRRIVMQIGDSGVVDTISAHTWTPTNAIKCIFDLVGGQVAVGPTLIGGGGFSVIGAEIAQFPNNWFRCSVDAFLGGSQVWFATVYLDNQTGTNAERTTYIGDGSSGVIGWRTNVMPIPAYGLNNIVFFDDFNDGMASIDLANTHDPSKTWFLEHRTPGIPGPLAATPNCLSESNSILTLIGAGQVGGGARGGPNNPQLHSFAANSTVAPTGYVGKGWVPPFMMEGRFSWQFALETAFSDSMAWWSWGIEFMVGNPFDASGTYGPQNKFLMGREIDFLESASINITSGTAIAAYGINALPVGNQDFPEVGSPGAFAHGPTIVGIPPWNPVRQWGGAPYCFYTPNSTFYKAIAANINQPPPTNPASWQVYADHTSPPVMTDPSQLQVYGMLVLPYGPGKVGMVLSFYNGIFASGCVRSWNTSSNSNMIQSDWEQIPIIFNSGGSFSVSIDWLKVTQ
jgi:hypothetical protein